MGELKEYSWKNKIIFLSANHDYSVQYAMESKFLS